MIEYSVTIKNTSNNEVEEYELYVNGGKVDEQPVSIDEGEHTIRVEADGFESMEKTIDVEKAMHDAIVLEPSDAVVVNPDTNRLEGMICEELAQAVESADRLLHVNKASEDHVEFYSPEAEVAELEVVQSQNPLISHEYEYVAKVVVEESDEFRYGGAGKKVLCERFESPLRAVKEIETQIRNELTW